ncbi:MAG TPA: cation:dicarboxylase symporter family transporter [Nitrospirales bacterium]|nr:cation:dicarboxylase symporter family transporter [Nitrospirales bacterium]
MEQPLPKTPRLSLSAKILLGMGLGIIAGIFFGELTQPIGIVGQAFIQLLQMAILPFLMASLMSGLGSLTYEDAISMGKKAGGILALLWVIALTVVAVLPLTFPQWPSAMFFSPSLIEETQPLDFLQLYIPSNPFFSLANSIVPAVVLFSIVVGIALIGIEKKQSMLDLLSVIMKVMTRVTEFVMKLAPVGVFAIAASAAGTLNFEELGRLQIFLISQMVAAVFLTFWVLPALVASLTPLPYMKILRSVRGALVTAFATGNSMIILPLLTEGGRKLLEEAELANEETTSAIEVIVPTSYTFPSSGLLLSLAFIPFAGWFAGSTLSPAHYPGFLVSGLASFFGGSMIGIPFLLDLFRIPADMFQLFVTVDVFTGRLGTMTAAMHMWVLGLLGSCALAGKLRVRWRKLAGYLTVCFLTGIVLLGGTRLFFTYAIESEYTKYQSFVEMALRFEPAETGIRELTPDEKTVAPSENTDMEAIRQRGVLRVGFFKNSLPFVFQNETSELVGFDIEMAHLLANDLGVNVEFVRLPDRDKIVEYLNDNVCDIVMSGSALRPEMTESVIFSDGYMDATIAFLVRDHDHDVFSSWEKIRSAGDLKIGVSSHSQYYQAFARSLLPQATLIPVNSPREFFKEHGKDFDALMYIAEAGSAWTLIYPAYSVAVPLPNPIKIPLVYPMPKSHRNFADFVNAWLRLKKRDGTLDAVFEHWILGRGAKKKTLRWSVIRDVLHWVN